MKFIDMFCGIGTIRMGMEQAGHECVYSIEWDKHKRRIYSVIFGSKPEGQDIRSVRAVDLPKADCWCFGAPCQDFSIAGKREGLEGDRSSLVREVFRLLREIEKEHRPKYLLYENVKGMLSSNKGFDFFQILAEMESLGYDRIEYSLLNSKNFGVPQNRERVFTIGHLRGRSTGKVFPIGGQANQNSTVEKSAKTAVARCLTAGGHSGGNHSGMTILQIGNFMATKTRENPNQGRIYDTSGIAPSLNKCEGGGRQPFIKVNEATRKGFSEAYEGDSINLTALGSKTRRGRVGKGVANTLDTSCNQGTLIWGRIRRLTPKECWRLQGIPDSITDKVIEAGISDTQMYRGAGDACTLNVIYEIAVRMR